MYIVLLTITKIYFFFYWNL